MQPPTPPPPLTTISLIKERLKEAGNVLFMILIAVALFAALAYAVTNSTRSGGGDASKESTTLTASSLLQYGSSLSGAVTRIRLTNSCQENQISFENAIVSGYTNSSAPADKSCHAFYKEGGGITMQKPPIDALDTSHSGEQGYGEYAFTGIWYNPGVGIPQKSELTMTLPYIKKDVCDAINRAIPLQSDFFNVDSFHNGYGPINKFTGWYHDYSGGGSGIANNWCSACNTFGKTSGCLKKTSSGLQGYIFYQVLVER